MLMRLRQSVDNWKRHERMLIERGIKPPHEGLIEVREMRKDYEGVLSFFENPTSKDEDWEKCFRKLNELVDREQAILEAANKKFGSLTTQELRALINGKPPKAPRF